MFLRLIKFGHLSSRVPTNSSFSRTILNDRKIPHLHKPLNTLSIKQFSTTIEQEATKTLKISKKPTTTKQNADDQNISKDDQKVQRKHTSTTDPFFQRRVRDITKYRDEIFQMADAKENDVTKYKALLAKIEEILEQTRPKTETPEHRFLPYPVVSAYNVVLKMVSHIDLAEAHRIYLQIKSFGYDVPSFSSIMVRAIRFDLRNNERTLETSQIHEVLNDAMKHPRAYGEKYTQGAIAEILAHLNEREKLYEYLDFLGPDILIGTCNVILTHHLALKKGQELWTFYNYMLSNEDKMPRPDQLTFEIMLRYFTQKDDISKIIQVYEKMKSLEVEPDEVLYVTLMVAFGKSGYLDECEVIYKNAQDMLQRNLQNPNYQRIFSRYSSTYQLIMMKYISAIGRVEDLLNFIKREKIDVYNSENSFRFANVLISCYCNARRTDEAMDVLKKMREFNIGRSIYSYSPIIVRLGSNLKIAEMEKILSEMIEDVDCEKGFPDDPPQKIVPDAHLLTSLMDFYFKAKLFQKVLLCEKLMQEYKCPLNRVGCLVISDSYKAMGDFANSLVYAKKAETLPR